MRLFLILSILLTANVFATDLYSVFSGRLAYYYDQEDRVDMLSDMYRAVRSRYALWDIKRENGIVDGDEAFKRALNRELEIQDVEDPFLQSKGNLEFLDRMQKLIAEFKDTHFGLSTVQKRPYIYNGLFLSLVQGEIRITKIYEKIIARTEINSEDYPETFKNISLGDRITKIDGVSVEKSINDLKDYIDASSEAFAKDRAAMALTIRNFRYPTKWYSDVTIFSTKLGREMTVRLPWYYRMDDQDYNETFVQYFRFLRIPNRAELYIAWDEKKKEWTKSMFSINGIDPYAAPKEVTEVRTWYEAEDPEYEAMRTGYVERDGKTYGYFQLFTFSSREVLEKGKEKVRFHRPLIDFVKELKEKKLPLIIDLRQNGGGIGSYPSGVLAALAKTGESYPNATASYRLTRSIRQSLDNWVDEDTYLPNLDTYVSWQEIAYHIDFAAQNQMAHTYVFSKDGDIEPLEEVGGYDEKVVALVTPNCISACDTQSMLFKASKRATIVGTHSNGTGAGYQSSGPFKNDAWVGHYDVLRLKIPNYLFGFPGEKGKYIYDQPGDYLKYNSENRPTQADVLYESSYEDLLDGGKGWLDKAIEVLEK